MTDEEKKARQRLFASRWRAANPEAARLIAARQNEKRRQEGYFEKYRKERGHVSKAWKAANPEKVAAYQRGWKLRNPETEADRIRRWREQNPERAAEIVANNDRKRKEKRLLTRRWFEFQFLMIWVEK